MKKYWSCEWETIPGDGLHIEVFSSLAEAKLAMRQLISQKMDLQAYLPYLQPHVGAFVGRYLSDPQFPKSQADVPEDYEDPEEGDLFLDAGFIHWDCAWDAFPCLKTNLVLEDTVDEVYRFSFWYEYPEDAPEDMRELSLKISSCIDYGTSAYPVMISMVLGTQPQTQDQIIQRIYENWGVIIDRKAVGRHLQMLAKLGIQLSHGPEGYYLTGPAQGHTPDATFGTSAYPLMVSRVLDGTPKTQGQISQAIWEAFATNVDRKAVGRHLQLLEALGCRIKKCQDGYYIE